MWTGFSPTSRSGKASGHQSVWRQLLHPPVVLADGDGGTPLICSGVTIIGSLTAQRDGQHEVLQLVTTEHYTHHRALTHTHTYMFFKPGINKIPEHRCGMCCQTTGIFLTITVFLLRVAINNLFFVRESQSVKYALCHVL